MDDLQQLKVDLGLAGFKASAAAQAVVTKGATNIKADWRSRWSGMAHAPRLPDAITFDVRPLLRGWSAEIGPDKDRPQGALGNLIEYGSENNAPNAGGAPALDVEGPKFEKALADAAEHLL